MILGLRNWVSTFFELHLAVMGLVFIAVVIWAPGGVMGIVARAVPQAGRGAAMNAPDPFRRLSLVEVSKVFGGLRAVSRVSLDVAVGERRVMIGPNGAGKTSLFHCISGAHQATEGRILCFGQDITRLAEHERTRPAASAARSRSPACSST